MTSSGSENISATNSSAISGPAGDQPSRTIWFEAEDFFQWYNFGGTHPTGIQRVSAEIFRAAQKRYPSRIAFCRLNPISGRFSRVSFADLTNKTAATHSNPPFSKIRRILASALRMGADSARDVFIRLSGHGHVFRRGDILVALGAALWNPRYGSRIAAVKRKNDMSFAVLVHDVIPVAYPQYVTKEGWYLFRNWFFKTARQADLIFTSSNYTRTAVIEALAEKNISVSRLSAIPFGSEFIRETATGNGIKWPERFVLFVSTVEIRKNHILMVRVWRRLIEMHGADQVPPLVFAGRMGWMVGDLRAELHDTNFLDGKVLHVDSPSDAALSEGYRRSLFTVYPSFCEGWGLPVAESLAHGKFCVSSNRTSLPEVGQEFCDYFDPTDEDDALAKVSRALFDKPYRDARNELVARSYVQKSWDGFVETMMAELDRLPQPKQKAPDAH